MLPASFVDELDGSRLPSSARIPAGRISVGGPELLMTRPVSAAAFESVIDTSDYPGYGVTFFGFSHRARWKLPDRYRCRNRRLLRCARGVAVVRLRSGALLYLMPRPAHWRDLSHGHSSPRRSVLVLAGWPGRRRRDLRLMNTTSMLSKPTTTMTAAMSRKALIAAPWRSRAPAFQWGRVGLSGAFPPARSLIRRTGSSTYRQYGSSVPRGPQEWGNRS
jgi:hypothetical protein